MSRRILFWILIAVGSFASKHTLAQSETFNVRNFGAVGDGKTLDTVAIQKALDACGARGGTVLVPRGDYLTKPLNFRGPTVLRVETGATIRATDEPDDFRKPESRNGPATSAGFYALLNGKGITGITITGGGVIDGSGARWWVPAEAARRKRPGYTLPRPRLILLSNCKQIRVTDITLQNAPTFHLVPSECEDVLVSNVTILAPSNSPNTDAIDPSACKNVLITHCKIDVGDDNVAIKSSRRVVGREFACDDITVRDCIFLHGHGVSIGSEATGGVNHVLVENCSFEDTENGLRIKTKPGATGIVTNILYRNITMKNVDPAITFTCAYMGTSSGDRVQPREQGVTNPVSSAIYRDISLRDITATCRRSAGMIVGLSENSISNIVLENVSIVSAGAGLRIENANGIRGINTRIRSGRGPAILTQNAEVSGLDSN